MSLVERVWGLGTGRLAVWPGALPLRASAAEGGSIRAMPTISRFLGIAIAMFFDDQ